jgi:hypothetical protein
VNKDEHGGAIGSSGRDEYVQTMPWIRSIGHIAMHFDVGTGPASVRRHQRDRGLDLIGRQLEAEAPKLRPWIVQRRGAHRAISMA